MNKEVHYEGWLIKSPPTKRIWRARWRRRWFTLKQGEIPEQFCLEYYTDRNCRKLKGVIDLDQCEQVDCGLRLENRKQKFQFMFDIKTPRRTYYLAADTEADMRDWVNCICQVCHLHDTKQSNDIQDGSQTHNLTASLSSSSTLNTTINTTTTSLNSSDNPTAAATRHSVTSDILRRPSVVTAIEQQPLGSATAIVAGGNRGEEANAYVNTEYTNRETLMCDALLGKQQGPTTTKMVVPTHAVLPPQQIAPSPPQRIKKLSRNELLSSSQVVLPPSQATPSPTKSVPPSSILSQAATSLPTQVESSPSSQRMQSPSTPSTQATSPTTQSIYLNSSSLQRQQPAARLAINSNGVVRKIPENLVLKNVPLVDSQQNSVQPSPALSTASGPYIPISECFSGSPKFLLDGNNPTTPLNNLDPKFYDTPRSHNTIGLNLTNDKSYSPKITNCGGVQQPTPSGKSRSGRSDSDSESVFTDDEEWTHPLPLRESIDRNTRPSDSSVENDSFVFTYSQRFSRLPDDITKDQQNKCKKDLVETDSSEKLDKELKNNLTLDEKTSKEPPQFSDTENASPAMGPGDAKSVVDENYDIPRSHYLPYCNMDQLFNKPDSPEVHSIVTSTPTLIVENNEGNSEGSKTSSSNARTLPRPHCYTNAAPTKKEENVFRYDFMEQVDLPPVNRSLKPKVGVEDKPPEEKPAKPPLNQTNSTVESLNNKMMTTNANTSSIHNKSAPIGAVTSAGVGAAAAVIPAAVASPKTPNADNLALHPPSVDRKSKPRAYKLGHSATIGPSTRRSIGAPLSMVLDDESESKYIMEACTLPRHPRPTKYTMSSGGLTNVAAIHSAGYTQQQRIAFAKAGLQMMHSPLHAMILLPKNEHKLQYFDLDVSNPPPVVHRQSMSVGNLNAPTGTTSASAAALDRFALPADPSARTPIKSGVVYNSVDFIKTEAFNRVREERIRETEVIKILNK